MNKKILIASFGILVVVMIGVGFTFFSNPRERALTDAYRVYADLALRHDISAFYPGVEDNEIRQELNRLLSDVLVGSLSNDERVLLSKQGLALLSESERDIDAMGDLVPDVESALGALEAHAGIFGISYDRTLNEVVSLARHRMEVIADIRGLSYRANFHTEEIFKRIIADGGVVTNEHAQLLNEQIPLVEEQFDRRSALYQDLEETRFEIERLASRF